MATMEKIFKSRKKKISPKLFKELMKELKRFGSNADVKQLNDESRFKQLRMLAAILFWRSGGCNPIKLFNDFNMYYEQMRRLLEIVCYRLEMIRFGLELARGSEKLLRLELAGGLERLSEVGQRINEIIEELSYQPPRELCTLLGFEQCDFYKAQRLKSIGKIFSELLERESKGEKISADDRKKIVGKMERWRPLLRERVTERFSELLKE